MTKRTLPKAPASKWAPRQNTLVGLAPKFRAAVEAMCDDVEAETGDRPLIFETLRTDKRQNYLFGYGRFWDDGRGIVTHSKNAHRTWHGDTFGLAADVIHPTLHWDAEDAWWQAVGRAAKKRGLTWGGDWDNNPKTRETFVDRPHVQWGRCRRSPSPRAVEIVRTKGTPALWAEVGAA